VFVGEKYNEILDWFALAVQKACLVVIEGFWEARERGVLRRVLLTIVESLLHEMELRG
jgi:hypothetical protein